MISARVVVGVTLALAFGCALREAPRHAPTTHADGRASIEALNEKYAALEAYGWLRETIHADDDGDAIRAWRTPASSTALWILDDPARRCRAGARGIRLTQFVLRMAEAYPPRLVLDLQEDELSTEGGYIDSQGIAADDNPVGAEIIRLLQSAGTPVRLSGETRFGEPIVRGEISRDRDGSIAELFAARETFLDGRRAPGPSARTAIVVETPAFAGSQLRVRAHAAVLREIAALWRLNEGVPAGTASRLNP